VGTQIEIAVTGGTAVTPDGPVRADVLVSGGRITGLSGPGSTWAAGTAGTAALTVDAAGCYVLPGGVDPHCHLMAGVRLATAAAASGGTTTALSFTNPPPGQGDLDSLLSRRAELTGPAGGQGPVIDVGLHAMVYDPDRFGPADLAAVRRAGASAIKVFLAYPELGIMCSRRRLFELMTQAVRAGLLVQVHCESGPLIEALEEQAVSGAQPGAPSGPRLFAATRPPEVEEEAVASALAAASLAGAPCYLVHLSSAGSIEQVRLARSRRTIPVYAEVCLHHLLLDDRSYAGAGAGRYLVAPPLRPAAHAEALWQAVADGTVDAVGSDHCQVRTPVTGRLAAAACGCAYGIAGIGARLPLLLSEGLARGIPIGRLVQAGAQNPARIFGHYPAKGALAPGSDADIVVYDPSGEAVLGPDAFADGTGPTVYAGRLVRGRIRAVLLRGRPVVRDGVPVTGPARGRYLAVSAGAS
jgi:dihydropyrimidinase